MREKFRQKYLVRFSEHEVSLLRNVIFKRMLRRPYEIPILGALWIKFELEINRGSGEHSKISKTS